MVSSPLRHYGLTDMVKSVKSRESRERVGSGISNSKWLMRIRKDTLDACSLPYLPVVGSYSTNLSKYVPNHINL